MYTHYTDIEVIFNTAKRLMQTFNVENCARCYGYLLIPCLQDISIVFPDNLDIYNNTDVLVTLIITV